MLHPCWAAASQEMLNLSALSPVDRGEFQDELGIFRASSFGQTALPVAIFLVRRRAVRRIERGHPFSVRRNSRKETILAISARRR